MREGHARRREIAVCLLAQRSGDSQREEFGKLPARLVMRAHWADSDDGLILMPRDLD